jgi:hypothetical protein
MKPEDKEKYTARVFQTRILTRVVLLIVGVIIVSGTFSYMLTMHIEKTSGVQLYGATDGYQDDVVTVTRMEVVKPVIMRSIMFSVGIGIIISALVMFFYLSRLAYIVYCLEKQLEEIIKGNHRLKFHFGRKIEFKHLSDIINNLQDKLKEEELNNKNYA